MTEPPLDLAEQMMIMWDRGEQAGMRDDLMFEVTPIGLLPIGLGECATPLALHRLLTFGEKPKSLNWGRQRPLVSDGRWKEWEEEDVEWPAAWSTVRCLSTWEGDTTEDEWGGFREMCDWCGSLPTVSCDCEERITCPNAGDPAHQQCGLCSTCGRPNFLSHRSCG